MKCPKCGEANNQGYRFCKQCGTELASSGAPASAPAAQGIPPPVAASPTVPTPPAEPPHIYKLVATSGLLSGRTFTMGPDGLVIGRDPANCQVVVADDEISRLHAWIGFNDEGELSLRDRHSANGTFVNGVRVQEKILRAGDEISLGSGRRHQFRIERVATAPGSGTEAPGRAQ